MNTTNNSIALEFLSTFLPKYSIALKINPDKKTGNNRSNYSWLLAKFLTFFIVGMVLISACTKEEELLPIKSTANITIIDTTLKVIVPTHYIAPTGSDAIGDGTKAKPWASLYKASQMVTTSGDIIHIAAGTYTEPNTCSLAAGVSLVGEGAATTIIQCTYSFAPTTAVDKGCLRLSSTIPNTNGNQTISGLTFDGVNRKASRAIVVYNRGNVHILNCIIKNFFGGGIIFGHTNMYSSSLSLVFAENNEVGNCTIDNCGDTQGSITDGWGLIFITCQKDILIHDNLLYNNKRVGSHNGYIINAGSRRFRGLKFYNNQCWLPDYSYSGWAFMLEFWGNDGGLEIYNNTFTGGNTIIDIGGPGVTNNTGGYSYTWSIHDNIFKSNSGSEYTGYSRNPILIESYYVDNILIYNNKFNDTYEGVKLTSFNSSNIYVYDNTFYKVRKPFIGVFDTQGLSAFPGSLSSTNVNIYRNKMYPAISVGQGIDGCVSFTTSAGWDLYGLNIYNNTIVTNNIVDAKGIKIQAGSGTTISNVNIKNNILCYMKNTGPFVITNNGTFSGLHIENNLSYNLANYNTVPVIVGNTVSNYTYLNNIPTSNATQRSPLFVNESTQDFHLQTGSPAINKGVNVGLPYSGSAPDISAYEF